MTKEQCFKCQKTIIRKYVLSKRGYSLKNNWEYWTQNPEHQGKFVCNSCLLDLYYNNKGQYLAQVKDPKKRKLFTAYVYNKSIS